MSKDRVRIECGFLRSGGRAKAIQVTAASQSPLSKGATLFGWAADGAVVNGTRLMGRVFLGMAVARALRAKPLPAAVAKWAQMCSHIVATSVVHGSKKSQIVSMWKDTVISHTLNERLNPIMQCTSVVGTNVNVDDVMSVFEKQMMVIDPLMRSHGEDKAEVEELHGPEEVASCPL